MSRGNMTVVAAVAALVLAAPDAAWAYIGPGSGLTVIGAAFTLVASVVVAVLGFVWYPMKRLWRSLTARKSATAVEPRSSR